MTAYEFAKVGLLPGSLGLFLVSVLLGLAALYWPRSRRLGFAVIAALTAAYWVMSMPVGAWMLGGVVSAGYPPVDDLSVLAGVQAIVVLDGGTARYERDEQELPVVKPASAVRALEAIRLYRAIKPPLVVITAGAYQPSGQKPEGEAIREILLAAGVPSDHMVLDSASRNTSEHAQNVSALLRAKGIARFALVTSAVHMRRAVRAFSGAGLKFIPAPAPLEMPGQYPWWPSTTALDRSLEAWYEVFGLIRELLQFAKPHITESSLERKV